MFVSLSLKVRKSGATQSRVGLEQSSETRVPSPFCSAILARLVVQNGCRRPSHRVLAPGSKSRKSRGPAHGSPAGSLSQCSTHSDFQGRLGNACFCFCFF